MSRNIVFEKSLNKFNIFELSVPRAYWTRFLLTYKKVLILIENIKHFL